MLQCSERLRSTTKLSGLILKLFFISRDQPKRPIKMHRTGEVLEAIVRTSEIEDLREMVI